MTKMYTLKPVAQTTPPHPPWLNRNERRIRSKTMAACLRKKNWWNTAATHQYTVNEPQSKLPSAIILMPLPVRLCACILVVGWVVCWYVLQRQPQFRFLLPKLVFYLWMQLQGLLGQRPRDIGLQEVELQDSSSLDRLWFVSCFLYIQIQFQLLDAVWSVVSHLSTSIGCVWFESDSRWSLLPKFLLSFHSSYSSPSYTNGVEFQRRVSKFSLQQSFAIPEVMLLCKFPTCSKYTIQFWAFVYFHQVFSFHYLRQCVFFHRPSH